MMDLSRFHAGGQPCFQLMPPLCPGNVQMQLDEIDLFGPSVHLFAHADELRALTGHWKTA